jgi:hypothetical protein
MYKCAFDPCLLVDAQRDEEAWWEVDLGESYVIEYLKVRATCML